MMYKQLQCKKINDVTQLQCKNIYDVEELTMQQQLQCMQEHL
jgi:hypothetical protein